MIKPRQTETVRSPGATSSTTGFFAGKLFTSPDEGFGFKRQRTHPVRPSGLEDYLAGAREQIPDNESVEAWKAY